MYTLAEWQHPGKIISNMTYDVLSGTLNILYHIILWQLLAGFQTKIFN